MVLDALYDVLNVIHTQRFGQDLPLWQSVLVKQSNKPSTCAKSSLELYTLADLTTDLMTQTIRPHHIQQQRLSSFKSFHRDGKS